MSVIEREGKEGNLTVEKKGKEKEKNRKVKKEKLIVEENERPTGVQPIRAAARDKRLKTHIMRDDP